MCFSIEGHANVQARILGHFKMKGLLLMISMWLAG